MIKYRASPPTNRRQNTEGIALITSLAVLLVVAVLVLGSILSTQIELFVTGNDASSTQAQYVAQAGLQTYKAAMFQNYRWLEAGGDSSASTDPCENQLFSGIDLFRGSGTVYMWDETTNSIVLPPEDVLDASGNVIGNFTVTLFRDPSNATLYSIQSIGRTVEGTANRQAVSTARAAFMINNSSVLEQAIFAGAGSGMRFINGNARIFGGVYVVGDESDPTKTVASPTGNFGLFNSYQLTSVNEGAYLNPDFRSQGNLCASFRVQYGRVEVGGSASLGTPSSKLLAVRVGSNPGDLTYNKTPIEGDADNTCQNNKGVCSISLVGPFDLEGPPDFPLLDEPPQSQFCPTGSWRDCIRAEAAADGLVLVSNGTQMTLANSVDGAVPVTDQDWGGGTCAAFLNGAASTGVMVFDGTAVDCTIRDAVGNVVSGFQYSLSGSSGVFVTYGHVNLRGVDMRFARNTQYTASSVNDDDPSGARRQNAGISLESIPPNDCTIACPSGPFAGGNFTVNGNFTSSAPFPDTVLTVTAELNVNQTGNNSVMTAPVYAGNQFRIRSGSDLLGQIIANEFCSTSATGQCNPAGTPPDVFFVPTGDNRPKSFRAIVPPSGIPVFNVLAYEMR